MNENLKKELWIKLKGFNAEACTLNHYDLSAKTDVKDPDIWKEFLLEQDVTDWRNEETRILRQAELAKLTKNISQSRSVGHAQLMGALQKLNVTDDSKTGPMIIYTYIPLNEQQERAENVVMLEEDIFVR